MCVCVCACVFKKHSYSKKFFQTKMHLFLLQSYLPLFYILHHLVF